MPLPAQFIKLDPKKYNLMKPTTKKIFMLVLLSATTRCVNINMDGYKGNLFLKRLNANEKSKPLVIENGQKTCAMKLTNDDEPKVLFFAMVKFTEPGFVWGAIPSTSPDENEFRFQYVDQITPFIYARLHMDLKDFTEPQQLILKKALRFAGVQKPTERLFAELKEADPENFREKMKYLFAGQETEFFMTMATQKDQSFNLNYIPTAFRGSGTNLPANNLDLKRNIFEHLGQVNSDEFALAPGNTIDTLPDIWRPARADVAVSELEDVWTKAPIQILRRQLYMNFLTMMNKKNAKINPVEQTKVREAFEAFVKKVYMEWKDWVTHLKSSKDKETLGDFEPKKRFEALARVNLNSAELHGDFRNALQGIWEMAKNNLSVPFQMFQHVNKGKLFVPFPYNKAGGQEVFAYICNPLNRLDGAEANFELFRMAFEDMMTRLLTHYFRPNNAMFAGTQTSHFFLKVGQPVFDQIVKDTLKAVIKNEAGEDRFKAGDLTVLNEHEQNNDPKVYWRATFKLAVSEFNAMVSLMNPRVIAYINNFRYAAARRMASNIWTTSGFQERVTDDDEGTLRFNSEKVIRFFFKLDERLNLKTSRKTTYEFGDEQPLSFTDVGRLLVI